MNLRACLTVGIASLVLLWGCASTPATRFYVLAAVAEIPPDRPNHAARPVTLVIRDVRLPQYLDRPQIVTRSSGNRLQIAEFEHWGGNLREGMTLALAENLGRLLESDRVIAAPYSMPLQPDYRVEVEVLRFEREAEGRVRLSARWWLTRGSDAATLASPEASFLGAPLGEAASYEALVASMSAVYGELSQAIAASVRAAGGA